MIGFRFMISAIAVYAIILCLFDGTFGELDQVKSGTGDLMKADD